MCSRPSLRNYKLSSQRCDNSSQSFSGYRRLSSGLSLLGLQLFCSCVGYTKWLTGKTTHRYSIHFGIDAIILSDGNSRLQLNGLGYTVKSAYNHFKVTWVSRSSCFRRSCSNPRTRSLWLRISTDDFILAYVETSWTKSLTLKTYKISAFMPSSCHWWVNWNICRFATIIFL